MYGYGPRSAVGKRRVRMIDFQTQRLEVRIGTRQEEKAFLRPQNKLRRQYNDAQWR